MCQPEGYYVTPSVGGKKVQYRRVNEVFDGNGRKDVDDAE